jgi:hypothetical protein
MVMLAFRFAGRVGMAYIVAVRHIALVIAATSVAACDASAPLVSSEPAAALYAVLELGDVDRPPNDVYALVATASLPNDSRYLGLESVMASRVSDDRPLAIEILPRSGPLVTPQLGQLPIFALSQGNLRLRAAGASGQLGAGDLQPGDSLELRVATEVGVLHAALRLPRRPDVHVRTEGGARVLSWGGDPGTALWVVTLPPFGSHQLRDTVLNIDATFTPFALDAADSVSVTAYDANAAAYFVPPFRDVAGVRGGLGVFGATVTSRTIALP